MSSTDAKTLYAQRLKRIEDAISLKKPDRIPIAPFATSFPYYQYGSSNKDAMYDFEKANEAFLSFARDYQPDAFVGGLYTSGKANEIAGTCMVDWPGRPGTIVDNMSTYQVIEREFMMEDEYPEIFKDYTGFMLRKYIPRAFTNITGTSGIKFHPAVVLSTGFLDPLTSENALAAYEQFAKISAENAAMAKCSAKLAEEITNLGIPSMMSGMAEAPFDILSDYFRGTLGAMTDMLERPDEVLEFCNMMADNMIESLQYFKFVPLDVKRVFFPLHKGMDGFMSAKQYEVFYWNPMKKIMMALIDMGVTPFIYTEGRYDSRVEQLCDVPKGKVLYHFETADMARVKKILGDIACISGNVSVYTLEYGTKQQVIDSVKWLIDTCGPGGGYIMDTDASIENSNIENVRAMFETCLEYGKY